jgi:sarcosine oxidase
MTYDVIVIGLGGMGSSACYHLAKSGAKVLGLEQFPLLHQRGSSHGQSRIIRKAYFEHPSYVPLLERSYELWINLSEKSGHELYHPTGIIYSCPKDSALLAGLRTSSSTFQIPLETLEQNDVSRWFQIPDDYEIVREPDAGYLAVEDCVSSHLQLAKAEGAELISNSQVIGWSAQGDEVEVRTRTGKFRAAKLIITAGAWTSRILSELGLPLKVLKKSMYWLEAADFYLESEGMPCFLNETPTGIFYGFPMSSKQSGLKIAEHSGGDFLENPDSLDDSFTAEKARVLDYAASGMKAVSQKLIAHAPCMYTMTPDENFVVDRHRDFENVIYAGGFSGHGFKFASVIGEILCELALENRTQQPIEFLRYRF